MVNMGSSTLGIIGNLLKEQDAVKLLAKVIEILEKMLSIIFYSYQY